MPCIQINTEIQPVYIIVFVLPTHSSKWIIHVCSFAFRRDTDLSEIFV